MFKTANDYRSNIHINNALKKLDGRMLGGAMYALERGLGMKRLAKAFALFTALATFGIGCGVQVNAISTVLDGNFHIAPLSVGLVCGALTAVVIFGGVKWIARVCEKLVPFMALFYVLGCAYILCINYDYLWPAVRTICTLAFTPGAAAGGLVGSGIMAAARYGVARGLFSNESGMGSAPIVAAAAQTKNPVRQALVSATGTFWDTVVVCLMTGLVLVSSIMKNPSIDMSGVTDGGILTNMAFEQIPVVGPLILVVGIVTFAYSTILGWSYYGERGAEYLGRMFQSLYQIFDINIFVYGGGVTKLGDRFISRIIAAYRRYSQMDYRYPAQFLPAELGDNAGMIGAALLVK